MEADGVDAFEHIATDAVSSGVGSVFSAGNARYHLFMADALVAFAVQWLERRFAHPAGIDRGD